MKITSINNVWDAYQTQQSGKLGKVNRSEGKKDVFTLSDSAKDFQTALRTAQGAPDIRADKVNAVRSNINSGTYAVNDADVAEHIISNSYMFKRI